ncbi:hypothetical protein MF542_04105 [Kordiimonas sp. 5E331]|nr:hypothetical protein [Kordiimonas laminariae]
MTRIEYLTIDQIPASHPVGKFHQLWTGLKADEGFPLWTTFKANNHPGIVPWMMVFEKEFGQRYRYKFAGTSVEQLFGLDLQGELLGTNTLPDDFFERVTREFQEVEAGGAPKLSQASLPYAEKAHKTVYRGLFGFSGEDNPVSRIVAVVAPQDIRVA